VLVGVGVGDDGDDGWTGGSQEILVVVAAHPPAGARVHPVPTQHARCRGGRTIALFSLVKMFFSPTLFY
jgi:hypothetical protein